jgi:hypothetical protein
MQILSIRQPWSHLIIHGGLNLKTKRVSIKDVENRSWQTRKLGRVGIHASKSASRLEDVLDYQKPLPASGKLMFWHPDEILAREIAKYERLRNKR